MLLRELSYPTRVLDLSCVEIRLAMPVCVAVGSDLAAVLTVGPQRTERALLARVGRVWEEQGCFWVAQCDLLAPLAQDELDGLTSGSGHAAQAPCADPRPSQIDEDTRERRGAVRQQCSGLLPAFVPSMGRRVSALVKNASRVGLAVLLDCPIAIGEKLIFETGENSPSESLACRAQVVRCLRYSRESWLVGCQFSTPLSDRELSFLLSQQLEPCNQEPRQAIELEAVPSSCGSTP